MTYKTEPADSDSVNLGSNPSSPATTNVDVSGTCRVRVASEKSERAEQTAHTGRTEVGTPRRIQRKRTRGWKMPPNTVSVTRPGRFGNPFKSGEEYQTVAAGPRVCRDAADAVRLFMPCAWARVEEIQRELRGKNLACWCSPGQPCHADVLLEIANR